MGGFPLRILVDRPRHAGLAPLIGLPLGGLGVTINSIVHDGDIRVGVMPWTMTVALLSLAWCALGVVWVHGPDCSRWVRIGGWWTSLAFCGMAAFFVTIAIGSALGVEEEDAGPAVIPPLVGMALGIISMTPASGVLAVGLRRARLMPWWARWAMWVVAPVLPALLIYGGAVEGAAETIGLAVAMAIFAGGWILVGLGVVRAARDLPAVTPA